MYCTNLLLEMSHKSISCSSNTQKHNWVTYNFVNQKRLANTPGGSFSILLNAKSLQ